MKETFFIRTVDVDRLNDAIDYKWRITGETDLYIFMNRITFRSLYEEIEMLNPFVKFKPLKTNSINQSPLGLYMGCKVFEDNTLEYGEIEIR